MRAAQRTVLELLATLVCSLDRAQDHVELAVQFTGYLQHDHRVAPAERSAIALITTASRVAEEWSALCSELDRAGDTLEEAQLDLRLLKARLEREDGDASDDPDFEDISSVDSEALA